MLPSEKLPDKPPDEKRKHIVVVVKDMAFTPADVEVCPGHSVTWKFEESGHSVLADDGLFASGNIPEGEEFRYTVPQVSAAARHPYRCGNHPTIMRGVVTVVPDSTKGVP